MAKWKEPALIDQIREATARAEAAEAKARGLALQAISADAQALDALDAQRAAEAEVVRLREALIGATAHLVGATSAYKTFAARHPKFGVPDPDALFGTRFKDFDNAVIAVRAALSIGDHN